MKITRGTVLVGLAIAAGIVVYKAWKDSKTVRHGKLVKKTWSESVKVQEYREVTEKGKVVPDGAEVVSRSTKASVTPAAVVSIDLAKAARSIRNGRVPDLPTPQVKTETVYQYKVKKWVTVDTKTITGNDSEPKTPTVTLENEYKSGEPELGQRRVVPSDSKRGIVFSDEEGVWHDLEVSESDYHTLNAGDVIFFKKIAGRYSLVGADFKKEESNNASETEQGGSAEVADVVAESTETVVPEEDGSI